MLNFFDSMIEYIQLAWQFFLNLITSLFSAMATLSTSIASLAALPPLMPWFLGSCYFVAIAVVIVNYIIGRSNQ